MRILIVDDNEAVRGFLRRSLETKPDWEICGYATNGREAISQAFELSPDVVLLDVSMPVMNGLEAAPEIRQIAPSTRIVLFSIHDMPVFIAEGWADAFVVKTAPLHELIATIERVAGKSRPPLSKGTSA